MITTTEMMTLAYLRTGPEETAVAARDPHVYARLLIGGYVTVVGGRAYPSRRGLVELGDLPAEATARLRAPRPPRIPYGRILAECLHLASGGEIRTAILHWRECIRAERVARGRFP